MPTISKRFSMLTNTTVENALAGSQYEFAPFDGTIEVAITATLATAECSVFSGPDVLVEPGSPIAVFATERKPIYPDDFDIEDEVAQGDRLKVNLVNRNAATNVVNVTLRLTPA
jgi:hypothetical protein